MIETHVGPGAYPKGGDGKFWLNGQGAGVMAPWETEQLLQGNMFIYSIASQAILLSATTGGHPTVINPFGSGKIFIPVLLRITFISGTTVIGAVVIGDTQNVAGVPATAGPIPTATKVLYNSAGYVNALRGGGNSGQMIWSPTTNTFTAAPTINYNTGINLAPADPVGGFMADSWFRGTYALAPGNAMSICYSVTTSTALFNIMLAGIELPIPLGQ
jgi:hypothetical protein